MLLEVKSFYNFKSINSSERCNNCKYIYAPKNKTPKYMKQNDKLKKVRDNSSIIVGELNFLLSITEQVNRILSGKYKSTGPYRHL